MRDATRAAGQQGRDQAIFDLVHHLGDQSDRIAERLVAAYREAIVEYRSLSGGFIDQDISLMARQNLLTLLEWLTVDADEPTSLETFKNSAVRRFRQGVSVQSLLHAYRIWGQVVWDEVARAAETRLTPAAGFVVAGEIMRYVNAVSVAVANSYLEESTGIIQDRQLAERDALEELIAGRHSLSERVHSCLRRLGVGLDGTNCVVLLHRRTVGSAEVPPIRDQVSTVRQCLGEVARDRALVGVREDEIIVVLPVDSVEPEAVRRIGDDLASGVDAFVVGVSRNHAGTAGVAAGYREAHDAVLVADARPEERRAYFYTDVILQQVLVKSGLAEEVAEETVAPLAAYDEAHRAQLLPTLRTYVALRLNLTRTAAELNVQPNTVKYRLERIREVSGRDPYQIDDLLLLALGVRVEGHLGD